MMNDKCRVSNNNKNSATLCPKLITESVIKVFVAEKKCRLKGKTQKLRPWCMIIIPEGQQQTGCSLLFFPSHPPPRNSETHQL